MITPALRTLVRQLHLIAWPGVPAGTKELDLLRMAQELSRTQINDGSRQSKRNGVVAES